MTEQRDALTVAGRSGRPPTLLTLNPEIGAFGGVDFGHSSVRVAIADVTGTLLAEDRLDLDVDNAAELAIAGAVDRLPALVAQAGLPRQQLLGVGAAISAPVRRGGASVAAAGILPGWSAVSPQRELARRLGVPVHVGNDANLGALAEVRTGAARGASDVVYVMLSSGVGGGLVLNGSLFTGHSGMTGELGHVQVDPEGELCRCGNRGCLETVAGAQALLARLRVQLRREIGLVEAVERAHAGDELCRRMFREAGVAAGRVAGGICNVVNPELVIVGGDLIVAGELLVDAVREGLEQTSIPAVRSDVAVVAGDAGRPSRAARGDRPGHRAGRHRRGGTRPPEPRRPGRSGRRDSARDRVGHGGGAVGAPGDRVVVGVGHLERLAPLGVGGRPVPARRRAAASGGGRRPSPAARTGTTTARRAARHRARRTGPARRLSPPAA